MVGFSFPSFFLFSFFLPFPPLCPPPRSGPCFVPSPCAFLLQPSRSGSVWCFCFDARSSLRFSSAACQGRLPACFLLSLPFLFLCSACMLCAPFALPLLFFRLLPHCFLWLACSLPPPHSFHCPITGLFVCAGEHVAKSVIRYPRTNKRMLLLWV